MPGRCRGNGTAPRIGRSLGRTSIAAKRGGGGAGDGGGGVGEDRRDAEKAGGLAVLGLGQAILRSAGLAALLNVTFSVGRAACGSRGSEAVGAAALPTSLAAAMAVPVVAGEDG